MTESGEGNRIVREVVFDRSVKDSSFYCTSCACLPSCLTLLLSTVITPDKI